MFAFLGTVYALGIRIATIQGFSPLKSSLASVLLVGMMLIMLPVAPRLLVRFNTKWVLGAGLVIMGIGDVWLAAAATGDASYGRIWAPLLIVGIGIALALASFTAGAVNGMPTHLAGMASGANNMLRDLGATLGPAVIGAVALSQAAGRVSSAVAASPSLRGAVAAFTASAAHAPPPSARHWKGPCTRCSPGRFVPRDPRDGDAAERPCHPVQPAARRGLQRPDPRLLHRLGHLRGSRVRRGRARLHHDEQPFAGHGVHRGRGR